MGEILIDSRGKRAAREGARGGERARERAHARARTRSLPHPLRPPPLSSSPPPGDPPSRLPSAPARSPAAAHPAPAQPASGTSGASTLCPAEALPRPSADLGRCRRDWPGPAWAGWAPPPGLPGQKDNGGFVPSALPARANFTFNLRLIRLPPREGAA